MIWKCLCVSIIVLLLPVLCLFAGDTCVTDDGVAECKLLEDCSPLLLEIRRAGQPMPNYIRRKLQSLNCGFDADKPLVCCTEVRSGNPSSNTNVIPEPHRNQGGGSSENKNGSPGDSTPVDIRRHRNFRLLPTNCGVTESDRIWGGNRTRLYDMPWMVLISYDSPRGPKLSCGGTLISERYVLTAAHCVSFLGKRLRLSGMILGEYDTRKDPDCERVEGELQCAPGIRNITIDSVIAHPGYNPQTLFDDIALVRLSEPADFSLDSMKPICLPTTPELQRDTLEGRNGTVAGWGATEDGLMSPVLRSVDLPIISNEDCQNAYRGTPRIYPKQLCAGGVENMDSCGGDSGGPLIHPGKVATGGLRFVQRGIVSFGSKRCGVGGFPGVYTRVGHYMCWILDNMRE